MSFRFLTTARFHGNVIRTNDHYSSVPDFLTINLSAFIFNLITFNTLIQKVINPKMLYINDRETCNF